MSRCFLMIFAILVLPSTAFGDDTRQKPEIGKPAPDFAATDAENRDRRLSEFRGGPVVLIFTRAHW